MFCWLKLQFFYFMLDLFGPRAFTSDRQTLPEQARPPFPLLPPDLIFRFVAWNRATRQRRLPLWKLQTFNQNPTNDAGWTKNLHRRSAYLKVSTVLETKWSQWRSYRLLSECKDDPRRRTWAASLICVIWPSFWLSLIASQWPATFIWCLHTHTPTHTHTHKKSLDSLN